MRARNLKPGYFRNELLGKSDPLIGTLFQGLWCEADREGRLEDRPLRLCGTIFPYRRSVTEKKVDKMLAWLHEHGFITRYEVDGRRYIQVMEFKKHQNPHKNESPSKIQSLSSLSHHTRTVLASDVNGSTTGVNSTIYGSRPADSLIPDSSLRDTRGSACGIDQSRPEAEPTQAASVCLAMKGEGVTGSNSAHPDLLALLAEGAQIGEFTEAAKEAVSRGKDFRYALGIVRGRRRDAAQSTGLSGPLPGKGTSRREDSDPFRGMQDAFDAYGGASAKERAGG